MRWVVGLMSVNRLNSVEWYICMRCLVCEIWLRKEAGKGSYRQEVLALSSSFFEIQLPQGTVCRAYPILRRQANFPPKHALGISPLPQLSSVQREPVKSSQLSFTAVTLFFFHFYVFHYSSMTGEIGYPETGLSSFLPSLTHAHLCSLPCFAFVHCHFSLLSVESHLSVLSIL